MDNPQKQQTAERVKQANNILITVSNNPTVDQLAACIGLTLALNKLNKHATAVFSGEIPNTLEFLQPEKTIEKTTDSLRDFIIALDKAKADKLRYKVEDKVVKIFITPYRTSISDKDLQFSQGDFNVDVVLALGVHNQRELDQAITAHGRILHDAAVITVNVKEGGQLGAINWLEPRASSLSELAVQLIDVIDRKLLDSQISTALLTGIVAETQRFRNDKTSPLTMSYSAELMTAGANQQLVATKLEEPPKPAPLPPAAPAPLAGPQGQSSPAPVAAPQPPPPNTEGLLEIQHEQPLALQQPGAEESEPLTPQIDIDQEGRLQRLNAMRADSGAPEASSDPAGHLGGGRKILPPSESPMTAGAYKDDETAEAAINPLSAPAGNTPLLRRESDDDTAKSSDVSQGGAIDPASQPGQTLSQIEEAVDSPHVGASQAEAPSVPEPDLDALRSAVQQAGSEAAAASPQPPVASLGSQPLGDELHPTQSANAQNEVPPPPGMQPPQMQQLGSPLPPPPGPPPMMPGA